MREKSTLAGQRIVQTIMLLVTACLLLGPTSAVAADPVQVELTAEERAWLAAHPKIVIGYSDTFPHLLFLDDHNQPAGLLPDLFRLLNERLNINIKLAIEP